MITFLVRHGEAGAKGSWDGPDAARPLSPSGLDQAEGLVLRLEDYPVEQILQPHRALSGDHPAAGP